MRRGSLEPAASAPGAACFQIENKLEWDVHVIARPKINEAAREHSDAAGWLQEWWTIASKAVWRQLADVREQYPSTDQVGSCLVFDARGNNYRLICRVSWANRGTRGTLLVNHFLTHAKYDRGKWKADCK